MTDHSASAIEELDRLMDEIKAQIDEGFAKLRAKVTADYENRKCRD